MKPFHPNQGFTLIELMIVIVVVAVLAALAAPAMQDIVDKRRVAKAGEEVYGLINLARSEAIKQSKSIFVSIGEDDPWFLGLSETSAGCDSSATCVVEQAGVPITRWISNGNNPQPFPGVAIELDAGSGDLGFTPRGLRDDVTAETDLTLTSQRGWTLHVSVNQLGRVMLCAPNASKNPGAYRSCSN